MSNLAEGFERRTDAEKVNFFNIAQGSCAEVRSLCYVCIDAGHWPEAEAASVQQKSIEVAKMLNSLRAHVLAR